MYIYVAHYSQVIINGDLKRVCNKDTFQLTETLVEHGKGINIRNMFIYVHVVLNKLLKKYLREWRYKPGMLPCAHSSEIWEWLTEYWPEQKEMHYSSMENKLDQCRSFHIIYLVRKLYYDVQVIRP